MRVRSVLVCATLLAGLAVVPAANASAGCRPVVPAGLTAGQRGQAAQLRAKYFGAEVNERTLVPGNDALLGETRFEDWLSGSQYSTGAAKS